MSAHDNEELIDYEDEHDVVTNGAPAAAANGAVVAASAGDVDGEKDKKNFSGIHSTGFRYVGRVLILVESRIYATWWRIGISC